MSRVLRALMVLITFPIFVKMAFAWTPGLQEAVIAIAQGKATRAQELLAFIHNKEVNLMAMDKNILPDDIYQVYQKRFYRMNREYLQKAASYENCSIDLPEEPKKVFNPGTDTDAPLSALDDEQLTLEKLKKVEEHYQRLIKEDLRREGMEVPDDPIDTDTDLLPNPEQITEEEFVKCVEYINKVKGGTAYRNPRAAVAQFKIDKKLTLTLEENLIYTDEMHFFANEKFKKAEETLKKARLAKDAEEAQKLYLEAQLYESQGAKYYGRIRKANNALRKRYRIQQIANNEKGLEAAINRIGRLKRGTETLKDAVQVQAAHEYLSEKFTKETIETLLEVAKKSPEDIPFIQRSIAKQMKHLSPSRIGEVAETMNAKLGEKFTRDVMRTARRMKLFPSSAPVPVEEEGVMSLLKKPVKFGPHGEKLFYVGRFMMLAGTAYVMAQDGVYHALLDVRPDETVEEFVLDVYLKSVYYGTGFGSAYDEAIEMMKKEYEEQLRRGKPDSLITSVSIVLLRTGFYFGRNVVEGLIAFPGDVYEMLTGAEAAERKEKIAIEFLNNVRQAIKDAKDLRKVVKKGKELGVDQVDMNAYLDCMCSSCGGSFGGTYDPSFKTEFGHGPCVCAGPLSIWKTPIHTDFKTIAECVNRIRQRNYARNEAVFAELRRLALKENFDSVAKERKEIARLLGQKEYEKAADLFNAIKHVTDGYRETVISAVGKPVLRNYNEAVGGEIAEGLTRQARKEARKGEVRHAHRLVRKAYETTEKSALEKTAEKYASWQEKWQRFKSEEYPAILKLADEGRFDQASERVKAVRKRMERGVYPPAFEDPDWIYASRYPDAQRYLQKARALEKKARCSEARYYYQKSYDLIPNRRLEQMMVELDRYMANARTWKQKGERLLSAGDTEGARRVFEKSLSYCYDKRVAKRLKRPSAREAVEGHAVEKTATRKSKRSAVLVRKRGADSLRLEKAVFEPYERIVLTYTAAPGYQNNSWIGLFPASASHGSERGFDGKELQYKYIERSRKGRMEFVAPQKQGKYDIRLVARPKGIDTVFVVFEVRVNKEAAHLALDKSTFEPGENIVLRFKASALYPKNSWIGLFPSSVPHGSEDKANGKELTYQYVEGKKDGTMAFAAPMKEGSYDFRMFERSNGLEVAHTSFEVRVNREAANLELDKKVYKPGEKITLRFKASALYPKNSWIGLFPSSVPHGSEEKANGKELAYQYLEGKSEGMMIFAAPQNEGSYDFRMFERSSGLEVYHLPFKVGK